ncbi:MAG TPA: phasin family protein [Burkholderiales bacterium]|nr:phasin family protein [Burkholderiales bacterium]
METTKTDDVTVAPALKQQLATAFAVLEAITEGSKKIQKAQLDAADKAHAAVEAMHKRLAQAGDGQELWRMQSDWMSASLEQALAYGHELYQATLETESKIAKLFAGQLPLAGPLIAGAGNGAQSPLAEIMRNAYTRWIEASRQLYVATPAPRVQAPAGRKTR